MDKAKKRILIVEDEAELLDIYRENFVDVDTHVEAAENGLQAMELLETRQFDLVVTDLRIPHIHGLQLISYLKVNQLNQNCKILVVSSTLHDKNLQLLKSLNVVQILEKPVVLDELKAKVGSLLYPQRKEAVAYNPKYVDIFKESAKEILSFYFEGEPSCSNPQIHRTAEPFGIVSGVVNFFGAEFFGMLSLSCDEDFIRGLAAKLFDMDGSQIDPNQFKDLIGEIVNQVGGRVKSIVAEDYGKDTLLGIPFVLDSQHAKIPSCVSSPKIAMLFDSGVGKCCLEFALGDPQGLHQNKGLSESDIFYYQKKPSAGD